MVCLEGHNSCLQVRKGRSPGCHMPFTREVDAFQILHHLFRALGQEGIHIPIYFLRDNVLPFILCQAFYLQLTSFIYLIFTCYVSDLIVRNGISTLGVLWIWSSQRGKWSSCCVHLFPVASQTLASEQQDGETRRADVQMLFLNRSGEK